MRSQNEAGKRKDDIKMEKALLNLKEFCEYLGIGQTKARELLLSPSCSFKIRIGNRLYAHRDLLDKWLENQAKGR